MLAIHARWSTFLPPLTRATVLATKDGFFYWFKSKDRVTAAFLVVASNTMSPLYLRP